MPNALPSTAAASSNVAMPGNCTNNSTCSIQLYNHVLTPLGSDYCRLFRHGPRQEACRADLAAKLARPLIGPGFKLRIYLHYLPRRDHPGNSSRRRKPFGELPALDEEVNIALRPKRLAGLPFRPKSDIDFFVKSG